MRSSNPSLSSTVSSARVMSAPVASMRKPALRVMGPPTTTCAPGVVEGVAEAGEDLDLDVPPEALGVHQGAVHVEEHGLQGGAFGRTGSERGDRTGHPAHLLEGREGRSPLPAGRATGLLLDRPVYDSSDRVRRDGARGASATVVTGR